MTAIVGLRYFGGVLMFADSEESFGTIGKSESDKLCRFPFGDVNGVGTVIIGGAGDAHFIDCANQELTRFLQDEFDPEIGLDANLSTFAARFWLESIEPFKGFDRDYIPEFDLLITVNYRHRSELFCWRKNKVLYVGGSTSIGSGEIQIHPMLRDLQFSANLESMLFYGVRLLRHAKRLVQGVGGHTEAIALDDKGVSTIYGRNTIKRIEDLELNLDEFVHKAMYLSVSNITETVKNVDKNVEDFLQKLPGVIHQYRENYKSILKDAFVRLPDQ